MLSLSLSAALTAQTTHDIEAGGGPNGPAPYYAPQFITIQVGDIVRWTNSGGTHNVDGTLSAYPDNPEGFTSGSPSSSLWVFEHTFTIAGVYGFECSAFDHADTQFGTITVVESGVGVDELDALSFDIYPNPVVDRINISSPEAITAVRVLTLEMKEVMRADVSGLELMESIELSSLDQAKYLIELSTARGTIYRRFLKD